MAKKAFCVIAIVGFVIFIAACSLQKIPLKQFLVYFIYGQLLLNQNHNVISVLPIKGIPIYHYIYFWFIISSFILCGLRFVSVKGKPFWPLAGIQTLILTSFLFFGIATTFKMMRFIQIVGWEHNDFHNKSLFEKYEALNLSYPYAFVQFCQKNLKGYHRAGLITDLDLTKDPGMYLHRFLAYHLYPIDIRGVHRQKSEDVLIVFDKKNAAQSLPAGYQMIKQFNLYCLIAKRVTKYDDFSASY